MRLLLLLPPAMTMCIYDVALIRFDHLKQPRSRFRHSQTML